MRKELIVIVIIAHAETFNAAPVKPFIPSINEWFGGQFFRNARRRLKVQIGGRKVTENPPLPPYAETFRPRGVNHFSSHPMMKSASRAKTAVETAPVNSLPL